jgi:hypothetical protein
VTQNWIHISKEHYPKIQPEITLQIAKGTKLLYKNEFANRELKPGGRDFSIKDNKDDC